MTYLHNSKEWTEKLAGINARVRQNELEGLYDGRKEGAKEYPMHYKARYNNSEAKVIACFNVITSEIVVDFLTTQNIAKPSDILSNLKLYITYTRAYNDIFYSFQNLFTLTFKGIILELIDEYAVTTKEQFVVLLRSIMTKFFTETKERIWLLA